MLGSINTNLYIPSAVKEYTSRVTAYQSIELSGWPGRVRLFFFLRPPNTCCLFSAQMASTSQKMLNGDLIGIFSSLPE